MSKKKNPLVFLDVSVDGDAAEKIVIEVIYELNLTNLHGSLPLLDIFFFFHMKPCLETVIDMSYVQMSVIFWKCAALCRYCSKNCRKFPVALHRYISRYFICFVLNGYFVWALRLPYPLPGNKKKVRKSFFSSIFVTFLVWIGIKQRF